MKPQSKTVIQTIVPEGPLSSAYQTFASSIEPAKGLKIKEFFTRLEFAPFRDGDPALPRRVQARVEGKAFLVVKINESETVTFSEFESVLD